MGGEGEEGEGGGVGRVEGGDVGTIGGERAMGGREMQNGEVLGR